jgi:hypothetical protein
MGLFKRAAVRGMAHELVRRNVVNFPSKVAMDEAADAVADASPMPEMAEEGGHSPEDVAAIAQKLIEIGHALQAQAGIGMDAGAPPGAPPLPMAPEGGGPPPPEAVEAAKAAAYLLKEAAYTPVEDLASNAAVACMEKAAEEVKTANPSGALMHGGDKQNTHAAAAKNDSVAALDLKQRPEGAYHDGVGNTALDTSKGELGHQGAPTVHPSNSPSGGNSVTADASKSAALMGLRAQLKQAASTLIGVASPASTKNKETDAAKADSVAKLDLKNRPVEAYHVGQGNTNIGEDAAARIGKEQAHPKSPSNSPSGSNSVMAASKVSADEAFTILFNKCAEDVLSALPLSYSDEQKVAAVKAMMGLDRDGRQAYITEAHKTASVAETEDKAAKKEGSLLESVRRIASAPAA